MAPVVEAYQAMRGASFLVAVTFAAEIGDVRRFDTPRRLMSFLGLVPAESSTGDTVRRKGLTLAGDRPAGADRGGLDLSSSVSLSRTGQRDPESAAGGTAEVCARHRLEGADPSVRPLPPAQRHGQEAAHRRSRDRARDGCVPLGYRSGGRANIKAGALSPSRRPEPGAEHERWGTPVARLVAGLMPDARPLDLRKAPRRRHGRRRPTRG